MFRTVVVGKNGPLFEHDTVVGAQARRLSRTREGCREQLGALFGTRRAFIYAASAYGPAGVTTGFRRTGKCCRKVARLVPSRAEFE